jgi:integrase
MASLIKSGNKYYIQFYNKTKQPKQKQFPTGCTSKTAARKVLHKLEAEYVTGHFDPWEKLAPVEPKYRMLSEIIELYIHEKSNTTWSKTTIHSNGKLFEKISRKIGHYQLSELTVDPFNQFINADKKAHATRVGYKAKMSAFLNWAISNSYMQIGMPIELMIKTTSSTQASTINYFTKEDIQILTSYIRGVVSKDLTTGYQTEKFNAMWLVDFIHWQRLSGMRLSETLNLRAGDINTQTWEITIGNDHFVTKSKKKQILPIESVEPLKEIARKKLAQCKSDEDRLFGHSCRRHTNRIFNKYLKGALPKKKYLNIHSLRHTCCIELLRAGVPIYTVQRWLRHADVKTTQRYADLLNMDISEQVGRALNRCY